MTIVYCHPFHSRVCAIGLLALVFVLSQAAGAGAQVSRVGATLDGTVSDRGGGLIANVSVTLRNSGTGQTRLALTDERGSFHAAELAVGTYEVSVLQAGFASYTHTGVDLALGQSVRLDIVLVPASQSAEVTVSGQPPAPDPVEKSGGSLVGPGR